MSYNLDDQVPEYFEFTLGGHQYQMTYPTTEQIDEAAKLKDSAKQTEFAYSLIKPQGDAPPIQEALKKVNLKVVNRFNKMVETEFTAD